MRYDRGVQPDDSLSRTLARLEADPDYVALERLPGVKVELKYASTDNFMGRDVYGPFRRAFLHLEAAQKLRRAVSLLQAERPGWQLLVYDALRPRSIQRVLWAFVVGTDQEGYVANPEHGSVHNYGLAVDLTVIDAESRPLDMGSGFDCFQPLSQPKLEERLVASGELSAGHLENRLILRRAMTGAGFLQLPHEWWHYDALPREEIRARFAIID